MKYFFNCALTALVSVIIAVIIFLIGRDSVAGGACTAGAMAGVAVACAYNLGGMSLQGEPFSAKRLLLMAVSGIVCGILGGLMMLG